MSLGRRKVLCRKGDFSQIFSEVGEEVLLLFLVL